MNGQKFIMPPELMISIYERSKALREKFISQLYVHEPEPTCNCSECYYFKRIGDVNTCGLQHAILRPTTVGCLGGWKDRNIEIERMMKYGN